MNNDNHSKPNTLSPSYYNKEGHLSCYEIQDTLVSDLEGIESYYMGNVVKYLYRYKNKNGVEDLRKALTYVQFLISHNDNTELKPHELYRQHGIDEQYEQRYKQNHQD